VQAPVAEPVPPKRRKGALLVAIPLAAVALVVVVLVTWRSSTPASPAMGTQPQTSSPPPKAQPTPAPTPVEELAPTPVPTPVSSVIEAVPKPKVAPAASVPIVAPPIASAPKVAPKKPEGEPKKVESPKTGSSASGWGDRW
jgi:hypothetical protein